MIRNYLTIAYRNLLKNKVFSAINVLGLSIGMAACLLILQYVSFELSFDDFHEKGKNIYRVSLQSYKDGVLENKTAKTYPALGEVIKNDFPEVADFTRMVILGEAIIVHEETSIREKQIFLTDSSFFNLFSFAMVNGDAKKALAQPFTVLISRATAKKIFGEANPMNKTLKLYSNNLDGAAPFIIKGVFEDVPANSHIKPQVLISYSTLHQFIGKEIDQSWQWNELYTYIQLHPRAGIQKLNDKLSNIAATYNGKALQESNSRWEFFLQPLQDIHLHSDLLHEPEVTGSAMIVYFLLVVALFILIIALFNFINLTTAQSVKRAKEVGIRKVSGAFRSQLIFQFLTESFLLNLLSILLALTIVQLCLNPFKSLVGIPLHFSIWQDGILLLCMLALLLLSSLISSAYPALALSSYKPVQVLKGHVKYETKGVLLRKGLVVLQFTMSVLLIAGTIAAHSQLSFMLNSNLGIELNQTLVIQAPKATDASPGNWEIFKNNLNADPGISIVAAANEIPGKEIYWRNANISLPNQKPTTTFTGALVDVHYFDLLRVKKVAGRHFDSKMDSRDKSVVINEEAARVLGFAKPQDALFQKVKIRNNLLDIVGVVENFHQQSLKRDVEPMVFRYASDGYGFNFYLIRTNQQNASQLVANAKKVFDQVFPGNPFDYFFLDEFYNAQYKADKQVGKVVGIFTGLAIFVSCLGLFGLASYTATQRTKEIGVRKVLGASVSNIVSLLSKDFIKLILLANLIAWPLAYWGISKWLENYAFSVEISPWLFILPSVLVLAIALLTIGFQTIKAARANPVKSLRYE